MTKFFSSIYTFLFAGVLFLGCTYWIYKNVIINDLIGGSSVPPITMEKETSVESVKKLKYEIRNNDIVEVVSPDAVKLIIDGSKIEDFESFHSFSISPDGKKICFSVNTITPVWLYVANIDGSSIKQVGLAINCTWSADNTKVAYNNHTTDVSPIDIYVYDYSKGKSVNLTSSLQKSGYFTQYSNIKWEDSNLISTLFVRLLKTDITKTQVGNVSVRVSDSLFN